MPRRLILRGGPRGYLSCGQVANRGHHSERWTPLLRINVPRRIALTQELRARIDREAFGWAREAFR